MKLPELKSKYQKLHLALSTAFSFPVLLVGTVVFAIVVGVSINGLLNTGASRAFAAPHVYQEELKIQLGAVAWAMGGGHFSEILTEEFMQVECPK